MAWVYRQQMIEGETAFGIIHNSSYFFAELAVYEDGVINLSLIHISEPTRPY